eukprot:COSAG04_NODE_20971_length_382_cov_0.911661_2_plen_84_part_01
MWDPIAASSSVEQHASPLYCVHVVSAGLGKAAADELPGQVSAVTPVEPPPICTPAWASIFTDPCPALRAVIATLPLAVSMFTGW